MGLDIVSCLNGHLNASGQAFCGQCGIKLAPTCPNGHATAPGQRFCPDCGASLLESAANSATGPSQTYRAGTGISDRTDTTTAMSESAKTRNSLPAPNFSRVPPAPALAQVEGLRSLTLLLPTLAIVWITYRVWSPHEWTIRVLSASALCVVYFVSMVAIFARSPRRRSWSLTIAIAAGIGFVGMRALSFYANSINSLHGLRPWWYGLSILMLGGFVGAWSVARRSHRGRSLGITVGASATILIPVLFAIGSKFFEGKHRNLMRWEYGSIFHFWLMTTGSVGLGCLIAWGVDILAQRKPSDRDPLAASRESLGDDADFPDKSEP